MALPLRRVFDTLAARRRPMSSLPDPTRTQTEEEQESDQALPSSAAISDDDPSERRSLAAQVGGVIRHYELIRKLGEGGRGVVFLARDTKLGRLVAIKLLTTEDRAAPRLLAEAQVTARCRHDNIVIVHDVDVFDGVPYMVLEYLEGRTLRVFLDKRSHFGGILPPRLAVELVGPIVHALASAHALGVVHGDLKPENVFLLDSGGIKVLDFGVAQRIDDRGPFDDTQGSPRRKAHRGTLAYMSPEQWRGDDIDGRSDIWAVGIMLYELATGSHPLAPLSRETLETIADADTPMPSARRISPELGELAEIIDRCLQKHPDDRFGSANELSAALATLFPEPEAPEASRDAPPFPGLAPLEEGDAARFFGREADIARIVGRLETHAIVAVAGPSGAGKSSFVRAGVIPALRRSGEGWGAFVLRPGKTPLAALAQVLADVTADDGGGPTITPELLVAEPGLLGARLRAHCRPPSGPPRRALLFVDQFEELHTLCAAPDERAAFLACLGGVADDASSPLRLVISIRSDFLERIAEDRHFMAELSNGLFFLPPMDEKGLREALTRPLEAAHVRFESDDMAKRMLDALGRARCPLPLLQFTAAKLWEARDRERRLLTEESYRRIGGVVGALSTHADAVLATLSAPEKQVCRAICLRLVTPDRTGATVSLRELCDLSENEGAVEQVVERLSDARLLLVETGAGREDATVALVHESLVETWGQLGRWLEENTQGALFLARLRAAAEAWETSGEAEGLLWRDRAAEEAQVFLARRGEQGDAERAPLARREARYLRAVTELSERARRRLRRAAFAALGVIALVVGVVLFFAIAARQQASRADTAAAQLRAQNVSLSEQARRGRNAARMLAARERQDDPTLAVAILREVEPPDLPRGFLELVSAALQRGVAHTIHTHGAPIYAAVFDPRGERILTAGQDHVARVWNADGTGELAALRGHGDYIWSASFSPDGARVATASGDGTARVWQADGSGDSIVLRGHTGALSSTAWSPDGARIVTASADGTARVFDARSGASLFVLHHGVTVEKAAFAAEGRTILTADANGLVRAWKADGSDKPKILRGVPEVIVFAVSPDGKRLAVTAVDRTVRVLSADGERELAVLRGHEAKINGVAWSPDGERIATASKDKTARIWNADGRGEPLVLRGHGHWVYTAEFSPDGRRLVTASLDGTTRAWDLDAIHRPIPLAGHEQGVQSANFSPDGEHVVTTSDWTARVWRADGTGAPIVLRGHHDRINRNGSVSPDGRRVLTVSSDTTARIWNIDGSGTPIVLEGAGEPLFRGAWSPRGDRVLVTSFGGTVLCFRADGAGKPAVFRFPGMEYIHAKWAPDGERISVVAADGAIHVFRADGSGDTVVFRPHEGHDVATAWSPDGKRIASSSEDGTARISNADGSGTPIVFRGHEKQVSQVNWSPDGERIVTASGDATARVWKVFGGNEPVILRGHEAALSDALFSPDGARVLTVSDDKTIRVFRADGSGMPLVLGGMTTRINLAAWSPDGKRIAAASDDPIAYVWTDVEPFSGMDDPRLWGATTYCMTVELRKMLFRRSDAEAREDQAACERRVRAAAKAR